MMWDLSGRRSQEAMNQHQHSRSRSRSPHPPPMRTPSPAFPVPIINSQYSPNPYVYGSTLSATYPAPPTSPYKTSYDYAPVPRSVSAVPQTPVYAPPQVIQVVHHHSNHHSSSHKHKKHHSHTHIVHAPPSPMVPSTSYQSAPMVQTLPSPITPYTSYQSAPIVASHHQKHHLSRKPSAPHVRFSSSNPTEIPNTLLKPPIRTRVHSQPTLPSALRQSQQTIQQVYRPTVNVQHPDPLNPRFQYSKCNGRRKALCIGINYRGQQNELRGCVNDAKNVRDFLIRHGHYQPGDIVLLTDDAKDARSLPTRSNIIDAMRWLVRSAKTNDSLFFHYSGHGGQTKDLDGDEIDGWDEVIYPLDFRSKGHIIDDEMHELMVKPLPSGCRLTGLFDACHSGTVLDLPYIYSSHGRLKGSHVSAGARRRKATPADVISWSGCKDGQTSADTFAGGVAVGAMSHAFISALTTKPDQTYQELLRSIRMILHPRYSQKPQLGSSHHIDTSLQFIF